jgi:heme oxygenase
MTEETLHQRLRNSTRSAHEGLELAVAIERQFLSRKAYAGYLLRLLGAHEAAERALSPFDFGALGFNYGASRKSLLLKADLERVDPAAGQVAARQIFPLLKLGSLDEALGCVYVIEGSSLGARAVLPQIKSMLGFDEKAGASYFAGLGEEGKLLWRACLSAIVAIPSRSVEADRVVSGAHATFAMFQAWLPCPADVATPEGVSLA